MADPQPDNPSSDYTAMAPYWSMVATILDGTEAMRAAGEKYLPKFEAETREDYAFRRKNAKFTNVYRDIVENLAAKPFTKEVALVDKSASTAVLDLIEDIDGQGNHLHVFAANVFFQGINDAIDWILVDKTALPPDARTRQAEKELGARPYWVHVPACRMLAVYSAVVGGKEEIVHARILEPVTVRDGYKETTVRRVRVLDRAVEVVNDRVVSAGLPTFEVFEERVKPNSVEKEWVSISVGIIAIGVIPLVPFITGRRKEGSWRFVPPMQDAAFLQIEHYQQESGLKYASENTAFPMLAGNGVQPPLGPDGKVAPAPVGPKRVLYAPPSQSGDSSSHGEWTFIEPTAASLKFLAEQIQNTDQQLRELGRQPLTAQTGNLTVVTTAFAAQKGNSAIQAWCLNLKDALEQGLALTCKWLADTSTPQVSVYTDFSIDMETDKAADVLLAMRKEKDISRDAMIAEAKRRDWLSAEYDADADLVKILAEVPADDGTEEVPPTDRVLP